MNPSVTYSERGQCDPIPVDASRSPGRWWIVRPQCHVMKNAVLQKWTLRWILALHVYAPMFCNAAQFVDLTVQLEINQWSYWLLQDQRSRNGRESIFKTDTVHCVIGTNTWLMEGDFVRNAFTKIRFTGTSIIEDTVITNEPSEADKQKFEQAGFPLTSPPVGRKMTQTYYTADGNPGRPIRERDLMTLRANICWLALCSGPALQREGRQLFPPSDQWKNLVSAPAGFTDKTTVFEDGLGLPRSIELFTPEQRRIFQYQVRQTTNFNGWEIPLEFYGVQYRPAETNSWELHLTFKGKVTAIGVGNEPKLSEQDKSKIQR